MRRGATAPIFALLVLAGLGLVLVLALLLATAGPAAADNCSSPGDCEQTGGYNGIIAVVGGLAAVAAAAVAVLAGAPKDQQIDLGIVQVDFDTLAVAPDHPARLTITGWRVGHDGVLQRIDMPLRIDPDAGAAPGLLITPTNQGVGQLVVDIAVDRAWRDARKVTLRASGTWKGRTAEVPVTIYVYQLVVTVDPPSLPRSTSDPSPLFTTQVTARLAAPPGFDTGPLPIAIAYNNCWKLAFVYFGSDQPPTPGGCPRCGVDACPAKYRPPDPHDRARLLDLGPRFWCNTFELTVDSITTDGQLLLVDSANPSPPAAIYHYDHLDRFWDHSRGRLRRQSSTIRVVVTNSGVERAGAFLTVGQQVMSARVCWDYPIFVLSGEVKNTAAEMMSEANFIPMLASRFGYGPRPVFEESGTNAQICAKLRTAQLDARPGTVIVIGKDHVGMVVAPNRVRHFLQGLPGQMQGTWINRDQLRNYVETWLLESIPPHFERPSVYEDSLQGFLDRFSQQQQVARGEIADPIRTVRAFVPAPGLEDVGRNIG